ncbi:MAG: RNase adapter RapZ [Oscillospiraceae bacterium]
MELLIISGQSGAGKSRVAAVLEDMNFYCVDNMPVVMMPLFAELCLATRGRFERVALVTDVRGQESFDKLFDALGKMRSMGCEYKILYIGATVETVVKRYKETRRRHPLDPEGKNLELAVQKEIELLAPVKNRADYVIDTSELTLGKLQRKLYKLFAGEPEGKGLRVNIMSFGYKYGIPIEADLVFDVRFLPNPYYVQDLKILSGLDAPVSDFVFSHEESGQFMTKLTDMIGFLLPNYEEEGKTSLSICIGCTGGHHRSVAIAVKLAEFIAQKGYQVECTHRDVNKT